MVVLRNSLKTNSDFNTNASAFLDKRAQITTTITVSDNL